MQWYVKATLRLGGKLPTLCDGRKGIEADSQHIIRILGIDAGRQRCYPALYFTGVNFCMKEAVKKKSIDKDRIVSEIRKTAKLCEENLAGRKFVYVLP